MLASLFISIALPWSAHAQTITTQLRWEPGAISRQIDWLYHYSHDRYRSDVETGVAVGIRFNNLILRAAFALERMEATNTEQGEDGYLREENFQKKIVLATPSIIAQYCFPFSSPNAFVPFVIGRLGRTVASITESNQCDGAECTPYAREGSNDNQTLFSPLQITLGGGVDYFLSKKVSLGMETGMRFSWGSGSYILSNEAEGESVFLSDSLYGVVTLNFFWI